MSVTNLRMPLEKRFATLSGELAHVHVRIDRVRNQIQSLNELEDQATQLERQIANVRNTLEDAYPGWEPGDTKPVRKWEHRNPVPFGQCGRRGLNVLRDSARPMTVREVARAVLHQCGAEEVDAEALRRVQNAVEASFRKFQGRTVESSGKYPAQWRAINKPEIEFDP